LVVNDEFKQEGCNPVCVVSTESKTAEINWRCLNNDSQKNNLIIVSLPKPNQVVKSPLLIKGEARGSWYFEGSFPIRIVDSNGNIIGSTIAKAGSNWMTENYVPFEAQITFPMPSTSSGILILEKDNPSGLMENADQIGIPIQFDISGLPTKGIKLYYYNSSKDRDISGNILCSKNGLVFVDRNIPVSKTPIKDSIELLLKGELTSYERANGFETEYPLPGVKLKSASVKDSVLTLAFLDPENKTSGGACRATILWLQIEETAKQFTEVSSVRFTPDSLFQP
jgi:hypothetical protein